MKISDFISSMAIGVVGWGLMQIGLALPSSAQVQAFAQAAKKQSTEQSVRPEAAPSWQSFTSDPGQYSVELPGTPTQFTSTTEVTEGVLNWQVAEVRIPPTEQHQTEYYLIAYTDLSTDHLARHTSDEIVQEVSNAVLAEGGLDHTIQLQEQILFHDHPAQLLIGAVNNQYWVMVLSLVDGRIYTNLAFSQQRDRMTHFLDSFAFTNQSTSN